MSIKPTQEDIERHRAREGDRAETFCEHGAVDDLLETFWLPADPATASPSLFCCRACVTVHLSEGAKQREHA